MDLPLKNFMYSRFFLYKLHELIVHQQHQQQHFYFHCRQLKEYTRNIINIIINLDGTKLLVKCICETAQKILVLSHLGTRIWVCTIIAESVINLQVAGQDSKRFMADVGLPPLKQDITMMFWWCHTCRCLHWVTHMRKTWNIRSQGRVVQSSGLR